MWSGSCSPCTPSCSELGADSASQDTSLQSACEGGPCCLGPLYPLPLASPGPPQPYPGVLPGPSPWIPCWLIWPNDLVVLLAAAGWTCSWKQPLQTHCPRPRAQSRWGQGWHSPPVCLPLLYPCKRATSVAVLNVGWQIFGEGALSGGSWSPGMWLAW